MLYSDKFHSDDEKAAKKAGIQSLVIANFHYTDKIKAVSIQYEAANNDKGLEICAFNWKRPKGMAHANVPNGPKQVAQGYKAALKEMKPSVRHASFPSSLSSSHHSGLRVSQWKIKFSIKKVTAHGKLHNTLIKLLKEKKEESEAEEVVLSDDSREAVFSSDDGSSEHVVSSSDDDDDKEDEEDSDEEPPAKKPKAVKKEKTEKKEKKELPLPWEEDEVIVKKEKEDKEAKRDDSTDMLQTIQAAIKSDPKLAATILSTAVSVAKEGAEQEVTASARPLQRTAAHSPPVTPLASRRSARPRAPKVMK